MIGKLLLTIIVSVYYYYLVFATNLNFLVRGLRQGADPLYYIDILVHEAGHLLAMPIYALTNYDLTSLNALFYIFAGSLLQWLAPLTFVVYFIIKRKPFSAFTVLFWFGQSLYDSVPYIGDSLYLNMPLLSEGAIHDWNFLLTQLGWLPHTLSIAKGVLYTAITFLTVSLVGMWVMTLKELLPKLKTKI